jgi:integrase
MLAIAFNFGWRKGELLNLHVKRIDLKGKRIRLEPGSTKSGQGREVMMTREMLPLIAACVAGKKPSDHVFSRGDTRVRDFRIAWANACKRAGCDGLLFHDLRRSAVRAMIQAGIPDVVAMRISRGAYCRQLIDF